MDKNTIDEYKQKNPFTILSNVIYKEFIKDISSGKLLPGNKIIEYKIAKTLNVSRTPVNIAINKAINNGLFEKNEKRTITVKKISFEEAYHLYEARKLLEGRAAYLAAKRISPEELRSLKNLLDIFKEVDENLNNDEFVKNDKIFHDIIVNACRNKYIIDMYKVLELDLQRYRYHFKQLVFKRNEIENGYMYHLAIYNALKNRLSILAKDEIESDINRMYGTIFSNADHLK